MQKTTARRPRHISSLLRMRIAKYEALEKNVRCPRSDRMISQAKRRLLSAIVASTSGPGTCTTPNLARLKVMECATVKAVTVISSIAEARRSQLATRLPPPRSAVGFPVRSHSIVSSVFTRSDCGMVSPRVFAAFRLRTCRNRVGCSTGRSAGLAPFRIRSA